MRATCWIITATNTHSEYEILIAFARQMVMRARVNLTLYVHGQSYIITEGIHRKLWIRTWDEPEMV